MDSKRCFFCNNLAYVCRKYGEKVQCSRCQCISCLLIFKPLCYIECIDGKQLRCNDCNKCSGCNVFVNVASIKSDNGGLIHCKDCPVEVTYDKCYVCKKKSKYMNRLTLDDIVIKYCDICFPKCEHCGNQMHNWGM